MKTLDQVEARIIVNAANTPGDATSSFVISQPGSYYLTGNLTVSTTKHGISIETDNVTLDLNGFAIISNAASGSGIGVNVPTGRVNLCVRNGTIRGWRSHGVGAINASSSILERLRAINNTGNGLMISNESAVRDCVMTGNGGDGLFSGDRVLVSGCVADINSGSGLNLRDDVHVTDCLVSRGFGATAGILVGTRSTVSRCTANRNAGNGIQTGQETTVADCVASFNGSHGIVGPGLCNIVRNNCTSNLASGIVVTGGGGRIDGNNCWNNLSFGFSLGPLANLVIRNSAGGQGSNNYKFGGSSSLSGWAQFIDPLILGSLFPSDQPWANFTFE